jgi:hypothetical protein
MTSGSEEQWLPWGCQCRLGEESSANYQIASTGRVAEVVKKNVMVSGFMEPSSFLFLYLKKTAFSL